MSGFSDSRWESSIQQLERHVWHRVTAGFFVLIPLLATYLILRFIVNYVDGIFQPLVNGRPFDFPGIGLLFTLVVLYIIGVVISGTGKVGRMTVSAQHAVLSRIPLVKSIYGVTKQATDTLSSYRGHQFRRVVLVEWPRPNVFAVGFVTGHCDLTDDENNGRLVIYIPTVPNPTSGMLTIVSPEEVINTDITVEDAVKLVFSGGIVLPDKIATERRHPEPVYVASDLEELERTIPAVGVASQREMEVPVNR